jgi:hypothetical protein
MPSKGKKTASRQANLRDRKKRGKAAPQQFQAAPTARKVDEETGAPVDTSLSSSAATPATTQPAKTPRLTRRAKQAAAAEVGTYPYMGAEIRHIGIVASGIFVIIIALSFVLG